MTNPLNELSNLSTGPWLLTQVELAGAIGISMVHVNRVLQALRADALIQTWGTRVTIPDWERLRRAGEFDPLYLHLEEDEAA